MTTEDANALLKRMQFTYRTPSDIRGNPEAVEERLRIYRHALKRFDADILDRAWLKAAACHRYPQWPDCPDIVKAAEDFHALAHPKVSRHAVDLEKAAAMAEAATRRFMRTSIHATRATEGGFERELRRYVQAASWVQAQMICGRDGEGYEHKVLFPGAERDRKAENEWFARAREQAESGSIRVRVPLALIERWRGDAGKGRGR